MSVSLNVQPATPRDYSDDWSAITALGPEGQVVIDAATIVAAAALLDGVKLANGEAVTTYDFSNHDGGISDIEAHVDAFGPALLDAKTLDALRALITDNAGAAAMLDLIVARGLQISMSTHNLQCTELRPHLKGVNWIADEVTNSLNSGYAAHLFRTLGFDVVGAPDTYEVDFTAFCGAVSSRAHLTDRAEFLQRVVEWGNRVEAATIYWA